MNIVSASSGDEPWIRQLLMLCELPHQDITPEHLRHFWVIKEKGEILGTAGLEIHGRSALFRSLAVDPRCRNRGFATELAKRAEEFAVSLNIQELYLLTMTAESFFRKRGYQKIERISLLLAKHDVPAGQNCGTLLDCPCPLISPWLPRLLGVSTGGLLSAENLKFYPPGICSLRWR